MSVTVPASSCFIHALLRNFLKFFLEIISLQLQYKNATQQSNSRCPLPCAIVGLLLEVQVVHLVLHAMGGNCSSLSTQAPLYGMAQLPSALQHFAWTDSNHAALGAPLIFLAVHTIVCIL